MPLGLEPVLLLVLAFEVGLGSGLLAVANPLAALVVSIPAALLLRRAGGREWLAAAAALGALHGWTARALDQGSCRRRLRDGPIQVEVRLREPARTGRVEARPLGAGCRGAITLRWPGGVEGAAGERVSISGRWVAQPGRGGRADGLLLVHDARPLGSASSPGDRLRNALARETAALYGSRAGLVDALVLGRRSDIEPSLNAAFALSGLVHLLSISGFHVGLIAGWLYLCARLARLRRAPALLLAATAATLYVGFIGSPPPAARAAALGVLAATQVARQRNVRPGPLLAVTALAVTALDPWALLDLGGWLSIAALWGATAFTRWSDRAVGPSAMWRMLFASLGATLATAPLTALVLGVVAPIGIALNFVAIPLAAVAVPGILASLVSFPLTGPLARALAAGSGLTLDLIERLARWGARVPAGGLSFQPGAGPALLWAGLLLGALWILGRRNTGTEALRRLAWTATILLLFTLAWRAPLGDAGSRLTLHFLSVGQGDAALIRTPGGHWVLVDAGPRGPDGDAGARIVAPFLLRHRITRLSALVLSHAHADHYGGAEAILRRVAVDLVLEPAVPVPDPGYLALLDQLAARQIPWRPARTGDHFTLDGVSFLVLHPDTAWAGWGEDLNWDSVVLLVRYGGFGALLAGDLGGPAEALLGNRIGEVELLKVGHHGSDGSSATVFLEALRPEAAVVSVGRNRYGHPAPGALRRLLAAGAEVWRTDRQGSITVTVTGSSLTLVGREGGRSYPIRP